MVLSVLLDFRAKYRSRCSRKVPRLLTVASISFRSPNVVEAQDDGLKNQNDMLIPPRRISSYCLARDDIIRSPLRFSSQPHTQDRENVFGGIVRFAERGGSFHVPFYQSHIEN